MIHVFIRDRHAVPEVSEKIGIEEERLYALFDAAKERGELCVFEMQGNYAHLLGSKKRG